MSFTNVSCRTIKPSMVPSNYSHTNIFVRKAWSNDNSISISNNYVWTNGTDIYYSFDGTIQYVLDKTSNTWNTMIWNGNIPNNGRCVWTDGTNIYYDNNPYHYILSGDTWEEHVWNGKVPSSGEYIWTDGANIYYDDNSNHYILSGDTWSTKTWDGATIKYGQYIWTDGINIYHDYNSTHYVLRDGVWVTKVWNGLPTQNFYGNVWTEGTNMYIDKYILIPITAKLYHRVDRYSSGEWVEANDVQSPQPIEIETEAEMAVLLETADVGAIYKYTGVTTETYRKGALYIVEESE